MKDWNVVISVFQGGFRRALQALRDLGPIDRSPYHNVLVMKADNPIALLEAVEKRTDEDPELYDAISRVAPATHNVDFVSEDEFGERAKSIIREWLPRLAGRSFHVRLHRRGTKHDLRTQEAERLFDDAILNGTAKAGMPGKISFTDPDVVIAIDTIDDRAGLAMWTREELAHYHILRPD